MIISEIKNYIKYGGINQSFVGKWYSGLSDGTIKILTNKGYIIKRSAEHCDEFAVLFTDADDVGIPYENNISSDCESRCEKMSSFTDLGIKTYEDYRKNKREIFDVVNGMFEEYIDKHPEFVKQVIDKSLENYVSIKDLVVGDVKRVSEYKWRINNM